MELRAILMNTINQKAPTILQQTERRHQKASHLKSPKLTTSLFINLKVSSMLCFKINIKSKLKIKDKNVFIDRCFFLG